MQRCAIVAILGAPNAGKSTLLNHMAGRKRAIVTHKANTTRAPTRAVVNHGNAQLLLIDTPGILATRKREEVGDPKALANALEGADMFLLLVDAARCNNELRRGSMKDSAFFAPLLAEVKKIVERGSEKTALALVLNKIDLLPKETLLQQIEFWNRHANFAESFLISALKGNGVGDIVTWLADGAPKGAWLHPPGAEPDGEAEERALASEITREKLLLRLHQEIPYAAMVTPERWERRENGDLHIGQVIHVRREQHRKIILGKGGQVIRDISKAARKEMTDLFGCPVHLFLRVKLSERRTAGGKQHGMA